MCSVRFKCLCCELKINIWTTFLYFIMASVSLSFEENSENETNVERQNNNLELLDVTSEKLSFSDFMPCNSENHTFLKNNYKI